MLDRGMALGEKMVLWSVHEEIWALADLRIAPGGLPLNTVIRSDLKALL